MTLYSKFDELQVWARTFLVFLVCTAVFVPVILLAAAFASPDAFKWALISAAGWFAGGIIVGSHVYYRNR